MIAGSSPSAPSTLQERERLPVTVVTGFLGSGKTTLLRHLLLEGGQRLAVLVNEFGEVGIDGELLRSCDFCSEEDLEGRIVELANGCLCCTVQDDFLPTIQQLLTHRDRIDGLLVETSGLALPEPLLQAFQWPEIRSRIRVNGVVTLVDGEALAAGSVVADAAALDAQRQGDPSLNHEDSFDDLFDQQLAVADLVLVSRAASLSANDLERIELRLRTSTRAGTPVLPIEAGQVNPELVLGSAPSSTLATCEDHGHPPGARHPLHASSNNDDRPGDRHGHHLEDDHSEGHHSHHHNAIESVVVRLEGDFDRSRLERALLEQIRGQGLIRTKGWVRLPGKVRRLQIQAVGPRLETWYEDGGFGGNADLDALTSPAPSSLELVALGLHVDGRALENALLEALEATH